LYRVELRDGGDLGGGERCIGPGQELLDRAGLHRNPSRTGSEENANGDAGSVKCVISSRT